MELPTCIFDDTPRTCEEVCETACGHSEAIPNSIFVCGVCSSAYKNGSKMGFTVIKDNGYERNKTRQLVAQ